MNEKLQAVFDGLAPILDYYTDDLIVVERSKCFIQLDTQHVLADGKRLVFASLEVRPSFIAFHLMPIQTHPALLDAADPLLLPNKHGQAYFHFRLVDPILFSILNKLVAESFYLYCELGYIQRQPK